MAFADLKTRAITAVILAAGFLALVFVGELFPVARYLLLLLGLVASVACAWEVASFCHFKANRKAAGTVYLLLLSLPALVVTLKATLVAPLPFLSLEAPVQDPLLRAAHTSALLSIVLMTGYCIAKSRRAISDGAPLFHELAIALLMPAASAGALVALSRWPLLLTWVALVVCFNDMAAYFAGSKIGGPKICPAVSPKKTWSGSVAGLIVGTLVGLLCRPLIPPQFLPLDAATPVIVVLTVLVVIAAQGGDLAKSLLKRIHGVKDSGTLLPGHGGVLDRLDGILGGALALSLWYAAQFL